MRAHLLERMGTGGAGTCVLQLEGLHEQRLGEQPQVEPALAQEEDQEAGVGRRRGRLADTHTQGSSLHPAGRLFSVAAWSPLASAGLEPMLRVQPCWD